MCLRMTIGYNFFFHPLNKIPQLPQIMQKLFLLFRVKQCVMIIWSLWENTPFNVFYVVDMFMFANVYNVLLNCCGIQKYNVGSI
jgi:hypothetical protein